MTEPTCLFCEIALHHIPASIVYEDEDTMAFNDINPQAPAHFLVIPKAHIPSFAHIQGPEYGTLLTALQTLQAVATAQNLDANGYRIVTNIGAHGGQTVDHLHFHVLGGRSLSWPPG